MQSSIEYTRRKIGVSELRVGMYVCDIDRPWAERPFLFQGFPLHTDEDLDVVRKFCAYVFVDDSRALDTSLRHCISELNGNARARRHIPLSTEVDRSRKLHQQGSALIKNMSDEIMLVQLHTGEIAVVVDNNPQQKLKPQILILRDEGKHPCKPHYLDLGKICSDAYGHAYRISESLADGSYGIYMAGPQVQALLNRDALLQLERGAA